MLKKKNKTPTINRFFKEEIMCKATYLPGRVDQRHRGRRWDDG
jgi:hypothetical protein